jgi:UDP-glucose 4-epimerase
LNLLITGCNGFIAREISRNFKDKKYNLFLTNRSNLDIANTRQVDDFFKKNKIDYVIHTAISGGRKEHPDGVNDLFENLVMYNNLANNNHRFKLMINLGSGAEFDRSLNIEEESEDTIFSRTPKDYYGLSKNLITRQIHQRENIFNLRLFGCFGALEGPRRLIHESFHSSLKNTPPTIHQDKLMDFFYVKDLCKVIDFYFKTEHHSLSKDVNLCYDLKKTIKDIVFFINTLTNNSKGVIIHNKQIGLSYTGSNSKLQKYNLQLINLEGGIIECLTEWKKF